MTNKKITDYQLNRLAKGMWMLSTQADAFNQVWHLPTSNPAPDGKTFIEIAAKKLGVSP